MSQRGAFPHRGSVPNTYQEYDPQHGQASQPTFSATQSAIQTNPAAIVGYEALQWRNLDGFSPIAPEFHWQQHQPQQQPPQYSHAQREENQTSNISDMLDSVENVIHQHSTNAAPWSSHGYQQNVVQRFDAHEFRLPNSGAFTAIPDTRSQHRSFANDSAYYSESPHKRSAPSEGFSGESLEQFLSPTHAVPPRSRGQGSPRSVVSDSQLHKKHKRTPSRKRDLIQCTWPGCQKAELKNKSDLQKHLDQHEKPHVCQEPGCDREEGFGTRNDLERHRASVHHMKQRSGTTAGFICLACQQSDPGNQKWWPRKDNFKAHIGRKHADWDTELLVDNSRRDERPLDAFTDVRSVTSHYGHDEDGVDQEFSSGRGDSFQSDLQQYSPGDDVNILAGGGQWIGVESPGQHVLPARMHMPSTPHLQEHGENANATLAGFEISPTDSVLRSESFSTPSLRLTVPRYERKVTERAIDPAASSRPAVSPQSTVGGRQSAQQAEAGHACQICHKVKKRACDLRKHEKRHTRPYGCTFPHCSKRFGSRNDWKRHENTQHFLKEQWRCQLPNQDNSTCAKLFCKKEEMSAHLDERHGNEGYHHSNPVHFDALDRFHLGREGHHNFWCGFCNDLIPQQESVPPGNPDPRFRHIGDHFDKGKLTIHDWVDIEENKKKQLIAPPKSTAKQSYRESSVDDSDLGDDGIPDPIAPLPRYSGQAGSAAGYGRESYSRRGLYSVNKRLDLEDDAEGESDYESARRML